LGDFSPLGRLFILGSSLKIKEKAQFLFLFPRKKLTENGLGYILGNISKNSSDHPDVGAELIEG
jgi:hypothetical protein